MARRTSPLARALIGIALALAGQRPNQGCTNARQLHAVPASPKTRKVTSWVLTDPDHLDDEKKDKLARIKNRCPHLPALAAVEADDQPAA